LGLIAPTGSERHISHDLRKQVDWIKTIGVDDLAAAQLPEKISHTSIRRPPSW
jgi:hypothetical protein